jgi:hypothetical protein
MEFTIRIDITERLEKSLQAISAAIFNARAFPTPEECRAKYFADADPEAEYVNQEKAKIAAEMHEEPARVVAQPEPEIVKPEPILEQHEAAPEPPANDNAEAEPVKKSAKKKSSKKAEIAPEMHEETAQAVTQPESEIVKPEPILEQPEPKKEAQPPADDGMGGMSLMEASQQLIKDIQDAGVEMADANARVRAKANELGLNYGSITCLIKAIGYTEARKAAIGK